MYSSEPGKNFLVGKYYIKIKELYDFIEGIEIISSEESIGIESIAFENSIKIFPGITNLRKGINKKNSAKYIIEERINEQEGIVSFFFPIHNILQDTCLVNMIFSTLMGDLFGLEVVENIELLDIDFACFSKEVFPGPKFGLSGIKGFLKKDPPFLGIILKPNLGLNPKETGKLAYNIALGGADFIKDDELNSSYYQDRRSDRLSYVMDYLSKAEDKTHKKCLYAVNITSDGRYTHENAISAVELGANCLMINLFIVGFDILRELVQDDSVNLPIHTHRCMHDIFTSRNDYGVKLSVFSKLARLCGADFFHIGTPYFSDINRNQQIINACTELLRESDVNKTVPISSRSSILSIDSMKKILNVDEIMFLSCGAIYRNSLSITDSVKAMVESIDLVFRQKDHRTSAFYATKKFQEKFKRE